MTAKLLDLAEGRETHESWWNEHESEVERLLLFADFQQLRPRPHSFSWVPVFGSQKGAIAILEKKGYLLRPAISIRSGIWRSWTPTVKNGNECSGKNRRNSRPSTRLHCFIPGKTSEIF